MDILNLTSIWPICTATHFNVLLNFWITVKQVSKQLTQFNCNQILNYTFTDEQSKYCKGYERTRYPSSVDTTPSLTIPNPTDKPNVRDDPYTSNGGSHSSNVYKPNLYGGKDDPLSKSRISIASSVIFQSVVYSERLLTHVTIAVLVWILPTWHDIICFNKY